MPLLVRWPGKVKPGSVREDLVCFLDFAPTVLSLRRRGAAEGDAGPRRSLGAKTQPAPKYVFSCRDRMDETYDRIRSVRGERYRYIRNFHPELPYAQWINYMDEMPIMKDWRRLAFEGKLNDSAESVLRTHEAEGGAVRPADRPARDEEPGRSSGEQRVILDRTSGRHSTSGSKTRRIWARSPEKELIARGLRAGRADDGVRRAGETAPEDAAGAVKLNMLCNAPLKLDHRWGDFKSPTPR